MSGWLVTVVLLADPSASVSKPHVPEDGARLDHVNVQLDADALIGIGGQPFLGSGFRAVAMIPAWHSHRALGTWDLGGSFAYHNEPLFLLFVDTHGARGANHRTVLAARVGHTVHMGKRRRTALGLDVYGGWNAWRSEYSFSYPGEGVAGSAVTVRHKPMIGAEMRLSQRLHRRVGLHFAVAGVAPTSSSFVITFTHVGVGLSFYLR